MLACARGGAQAQIDALPARHRAVLDAYADGVNRALSARRPWELRLVRHRPEPWKAADCVLMGRLIGHVGLAQTQGEVERWLVQMLNDGVTLETLDELFGGRLAGFDPALLDGLRIEDPLIPQSIRWHPAVPAAAASNNWVLAPQRTQSGSAILAGDPHLEVNRLPAVWYEAVLEGPDGWLAGASMPGAPAILVGRNEHVAWSVTYAYADVIDSWVEDCRDGCFRRDDGWQPFDVREEVIHRRGGEPERVRFYDNLHGTLGGDPHVPGRYLATRWAGRDGGGRSLAAALDLARARDAEAAGELLSRLEWAFNWVLADRDGAIVYRMSGRIPRRREGAGGLLPLAGWRPADDWQGFHDAAELPQRRNPPSGWLATANEDLNALGRSPRSTSRARRTGPSAWRNCSAPATTGRSTRCATSRWMRCRRRRGASWPCSRRCSYSAAVHAVLTWACGAQGARYVVDETDIVANYFWLVDDVLLAPGGMWAGEEGRDAALRRLAVDALDSAPTDPPPTRMVMRHLLLGGRLPTPPT